MSLSSLLHSHFTSESPSKSESPVDPWHSHRVACARRLEVAESDFPRYRLVPGISAQPSRRLAPLAVEERVVAVRAAVDGPLRRFDPLAEVVAAFFDWALDV